MSDSIHRTIVNGSGAAMAGAAASHPFDLLKVRGQLQGERGSGQKLGPAGLARQIVSKEGITGLYSGLTASLMRQAVYSGVRFPAYEVFKGYLHKDKSKPLSVGEKVLSGLGAGAVGAAVANPLDLCLVRMQADGKLPAIEQRGYKNVFDALGRISKEEGVATLWRGCSPTVGRAMIVTASQFAAYDQIKQVMVGTLKLPDNALTHVGGGIFAGFVASVASNPVDVVKSRVMNSTAYDGAVDCVVKTVKNEGPLALYKGLPATCARTVPYVAVMFVTLEQMKKGWALLDTEKEEEMVEGSI